MPLPMMVDVFGVSYRWVSGMMVKVPEYSMALSRSRPLWLVDCLFKTEQSLPLFIGSVYYHRP
jgi:hypothetical protein